MGLKESENLAQTDGPPPTAPIVSLLEFLETLPLAGLNLARPVDRGRKIDL
jgi:hypothetical protein